MDEDAEGMFELIEATEDRLEKKGYALIEFPSATAFLLPWC